MGTDDGVGVRRRPPGPTLRVLVCSLTGVLVGLVVVIAFVAGLAQSRVADGVTQLAADTLPAHRETRALITASLDQETGQRGYLLLGDPSFLAPYHAGQEVEADAVAALAELHRDDPAANAQLAAATSTLTAWHREVAEPTIAARGAGPVPTEQLQAAERRGTELFDMLRQRLAALEEHTVTQQRAQLDAVVAAQRAADLVVVATAVLAIGLAVASVPLLRRRLVRPLVDLQSQTERTAAGAYEVPIEVTGPRDLRAIGDAVDTVRASVLHHGAELADARLELALRDARDRLSAEVHDNSIQRLFALGLALQAAMARHPAASGALAPLVDETDDILRELRELIAGLVRTEVSAATLRGQVFDLVRDSGRALGVTPALEIRGPLEEAVTDEAARELLAALREALANIARHARAPSAAVRLTVDEEHIALTVEDDGIGVVPDLAPGEGLSAIKGRAARLGGTVGVTPRPDGGTLLSWRIPRSGAPVETSSVPDPASTSP